MQWGSSGRRSATRTRPEHLYLRLLNLFPDAEHLCGAATVGSPLDVQKVAGQEVSCFRWYLLFLSPLADLSQYSSSTLGCQKQIHCNYAFTDTYQSKTTSQKFWGDNTNYYQVGKTSLLFRTIPLQETLTKTHQDPSRKKNGS